MPSLLDWIYDVYMNFNEVLKNIGRCYHLPAHAFSYFLLVMVLNVI